MRVFVAAALSDDVVDAAAQAAAEIREHLPSRLVASWVPPANMHLTVRFIGHVEDGRVPPLLAALQPALSTAPFDIQLGACGVFPHSGPPRVIWIGLEAGMEALRAMHEEFGRRLAPLGFRSEARPFSVHLTLARVKDVPRGAARSIRDIVRSLHARPARQRISGATVYESVLSPKGPTYRALLDVPCRA